MCTVYVYGCPRVGDARFSSLLSSRVKNLYRVVFRGDIVTTVPRGFASYKHAGWEIIVDHLGNMINAPSKREKALEFLHLTCILLQDGCSFRRGFFKLFRAHFSSICSSTLPKPCRSSSRLLSLPFKRSIPTALDLNRKKKCNLMHQRKRRVPVCVGDAAE